MSDGKKPRAEWAIPENIEIGLGQDAHFEVTTTVAVGESLYFIVDAGSTADCDSTLLTLAITY